MTVPRVLDLVRSCWIGKPEDAVELVLDHALARRGGHVCLCNVHVTSEARASSAVYQAWQASVLRFPDGAPIAWVQRRLGNRAASRVAGPDLFERVLDVGRDRGATHFLVGTTELKLQLLHDSVAARYPGVEILGWSPLPFGPAPDVPQELLDELARVQPNFVWVALGAPKQELWMAKASTLVPDAVFVGIGAAFDFVSGSKPRAPRLMRRLGLEWLHRLASEPRRLGLRYLKTNTSFLGRVAIELVGQRIGRTGVR